MKLQGKVAVVTGAGKGIGQAIAMAFAVEGTNVVINYHQNEAAAQETATSIIATGANSIIVQGDVAVHADVEHLLRKSLDVFGRVDILVNNAGITLGSDLFDITEELWNRVLDVNLKGIFLCAQMFGKYMITTQSGCIVNIASTAAFRPQPRSHHYVASKAGVVGLTKALAVSLAPYIRVNCVAPGFVETEKWTRRSMKQRETTIAEIPLKRLATISEIAKTVVFLASDGTYITGQTIVVDGGLSLHCGLAE